MLPEKFYVGKLSQCFDQGNKTFSELFLTVLLAVLDRSLWRTLSGVYVKLKETRGSSAMLSLKFQCP